MYNCEIESVTLHVGFYVLQKKIEEKKHTKFQSEENGEKHVFPYMNVKQTRHNRSRNEQLFSMCDHYILGVAFSVTRLTTLANH